MTKFVGVDGFKAAAKDGARPDCAVMRAATSAPEPIGERTFRFVFSDETIDRMGDSIKASGWDLEDFNKNAVALWCHDSSAPPIGRATNVHVNGQKLLGDIEFMPAEVSPFADSIYRMVKGGFLNAVSVGFLPLDYKFVNTSDRPFGMDFVKQQLLEISVCSVPANPNALLEARSAGLDTSLLIEWAEKVLTSGGSIMVPRDLLEETFRAAKTPHIVRRRYLSKDAADFKVGASHDLPLDNADGWDGPAAAKRMLDAAGFDGDNPDSAKAKRGFLVYDAGNPTLRGSYKLPFADISGGALKACKGGIRAAASRLSQTDAPKAVLDDAQGVIDSYEKRFGMGDKSAQSDEDEDDKALGEGNEPAAPVGSCGRAKSEECGMKDPAECAIHAPPVSEKATRSGRRVSGANAAHLQAALDHHESAAKCMNEALGYHAKAAEKIKAVLDSNETDEDGDGDNDGGEILPPKADAVEVVHLSQPADPRAKRLAEAKALKASLLLLKK